MKLTHLTYAFTFFVTLGIMLHFFMNVMFTLRFTLQERNGACVWAVTSPSGAPTNPSTCAVSTTVRHRVCVWIIGSMAAAGVLESLGSRGMIQCDIVCDGWSIRVMGYITVWVWLFRSLIQCDITCMAGLLESWSPRGMIQCDIMIGPWFKEYY